MNIYINNAYSKSSYSSSITSEQQHKSKDAEKSQKKNQIVSERQGKYYCTYAVNEEDKKVLLSKIPIDQAEKQKVLGNQSESDKTNSCDYNMIKNNSTAFECKQQMHMNATHRKNLQEVMNIIKGNTEIPNALNKLLGY